MSHSEQGAQQAVSRNQESDVINRKPRYVSHALVDVKTSFWNPFDISSAALLDLSVDGFKLEFVNKVNIKPGKRITMFIPLQPFNIASPSKLKLRMVIKWFDSRRLRAGGMFENMSDEQLFLLNRVLETIAHNLGVDADPASEHRLDEAV